MAVHVDIKEQNGEYPFSTHDAKEPADGESFRALGRLDGDGRRELSGGTSLALLTGKPELSFAQTGDARLYWRGAAEQYKAEIGVPLMLVGGIRSLQAAEELVASGGTDYVSLCRPLIRQPDLVNRWKAGESPEADCISCNSCLMAGLQGQGVHCVHLDK